MSIQYFWLYFDFLFFLLCGNAWMIGYKIITFCSMSFLLSFSEEVRIASLLFPPSPRLRLVKNVTDTKLVKHLAKYRRFSIGSLRKTADWLYYFTECFHICYASSYIGIYTSIFIPMNNEPSIYI